MAKKPAAYRITYQVGDGSQKPSSGHVVFYPDGPWLYPDGISMGREPMLAGALRLDPSFLEEQPDTNSQETFYLYKKVIPVPR